MRFALCLDLGGTKSTGALFDGDREVARAGGPAGAVSLGTEVSMSAIAGLWGQLGRGISQTETGVYVGLAGIGLRDRVAEMHRRLAGFGRSVILGDGYGALVDATGGAPGTLVAVGTGVAAMRLLPDGTCRTGSGWGFPAGDLGSGAWIGLQATSALTRHLDGSHGVMGAGLARRLMAVTGETAPQILGWLTGGRAGDYGRLAPVIVAAAEEGEAFACVVMEGAAREIADVALALWDRVPDVVHVSGGLGLSLVPWCRKVAPAIDWRVSEADPVRGLALMARGGAPMERLVARPGLAGPDYAD